MTDPVWIDFKGAPPPYR
ncbi:hypothetical protein D6851_10305 [Altericroceibacterium spongiae]|uniref:Uncharacterized protein n=1 Tax=Altericroceibacterium spongiae TaxID=2320269 RepID=A0A420EJG8_9SPHN|nr:hypothetical protein D6851_10305 [Altericroceibacterium spongiae]